MNSSSREPGACGAVFVSYRRGAGDSLGVLLGRQLQEDLPGVSVFVDRLQLSDPQDWWARTDAALDGADVFVLGVDDGFLGEATDGVEDPHRARTLTELRSATLRGIPIVAVVEGESMTVPADLPSDLHGVLGPEAPCMRMVAGDRDSVDAAREQLATAVWVGLVWRGGGEVLMASDGTGPAESALARWVDAATGPSDACDVLGGPSTPRLAVVRHDDTGQPLLPPTPRLVVVSTGRPTQELVNTLMGLAMVMPPVRELGLLLVADGPRPTDWTGPSAVEDQVRRVLGDVRVLVGASVAEIARAATPSDDAWRDRQDIRDALAAQSTSRLGYGEVLRQLPRQLLPTERVQAIALGANRRGFRTDRALMALTDRRLLLVGESPEQCSQVPRSNALVPQVKRGVVTRPLWVTAPDRELRLKSVVKQDADAFQAAVHGEPRAGSDAPDRPHAATARKSGSSPVDCGGHVAESSGAPHGATPAADETRVEQARGPTGEVTTTTEAGRPSRSSQGSLVPAWIDFLVRNATGLALVLGAVGYLLGYLAIDRFASQFGVPASVFSLDFRDYVVLALINLLFVGVAFAGVAVGLVVTDKAPSFIDSDGDFVDATDGPGKWLLHVGAVLVSALVGTAGIWATSRLVAWIVASFRASGPSGFDADDFRVFFLLVWAGWSAALVAAGFGYWQRARQASKREPRLLGRVIGLVLVLLGTGIFLGTAWRNDLWGGGVEAWAQDLKAGSLERPAGSGLSLVLQPTRVQVYGAEEQAGIPDGTPVIRLNDRGPWAVLLHDNTVSVVSLEQLTFQATPIPDIERIAEHPLALSWYSEGGTRYQSSVPGVDAVVGSAVTTFDGRTSWTVEMASAQDPPDPVADAFTGDAPEPGKSEWRVSCDGQLTLAGTLEGRVERVIGDVSNTLARTVCAASEPFRTEYRSNDFWQWSTDDGQAQYYWQILPREWAR